MTISVDVAVPQQRRCRVRVWRFESRTRHPQHTPDRLAGRLVDAQQVGRIVGVHPMQHLHVQRILEQQRRRGISPLQTESAVVGLDIATPELLTRKVERLQHAGAGHDPDRFAVGHRRRRRHLLLHHAAVAVAERPFPSNGAVRSIHGPERETRSFSDVEEHVIAPDDRRRSGALGHRELPGDVLRRGPADRQILLCAVAVEHRAAPLRPVFRGERRHSEYQNRHDRGQRLPHPVTPIEEMRAAACASPLASR